MIRVKVEIVPHGYEADAEVLDEVLIENDETHRALGQDEGGLGSYNVFDNETLGHLHTVDYPHMYACGFIKDVRRTPEHRLLLAESAIGVIREARANEWHTKHPEARPVRHPEREDRKDPPDNLNIP